MTLVVLFGPPAVGKMTVGHALAQRTGLRLFHNHLTIDLVLRFFAFGEPAFFRLVDAFRTRLVEEVAASTLPGLIFTYVWAFDQPSEAAHVDKLATVFRDRGARVVYVELEAPLDVRLARNETEFRLREKWPKRDLVQSRQLLLEAERAHRMNTVDEFADRADYLRLDNSSLSPEDAAERIIAAFGLPRTP